MEVHTHAHPDSHRDERKKWTHYLWEFLMLFLAVFCGFLAENFREHRVDRKKEKQAIESLVNCLASDTVQLKTIINANYKVMCHLDSLAFYKKADLRDETVKRRFLFHSMVGFNQDWYFKTNDAALQQLKSSGMLRLIHKQNVSDSIFKYEIKNKATVGQEEDTYYLWKESLSDFRNAVDYTYYRDTNAIRYIYQVGYFEFDIRNPAAFPITSDKEKINKVFSNASLLAATEWFYDITMKDQLEYAKRLIKFLKAEYHLD